MTGADAGIRALAGGLLILLALALLAGAPRSRIAWLFAPFAAGIAGFLAVNTWSDLAPDGAWLTLAATLAGNATVFLWWFCRALFDDSFRLGRIELAGGAAWFAVFLADRGYVPGLGDPDLSWLLILIGCGMVGDLVWRILRDRDDDLVEPRRRLRGLVAAGMVGLLLTDFVIDLVMGVDWSPPGFILAQNSVVLLIALGLAAWFLQINPASVPAAPATAPTAPPTAETRLLQRIDELIRVEQVHLDPDLTFADFARRLGAPEPAVRQQINQRLGHRHFKSFLNSHRVAEARRRLTDPAHAGDKMIAVAFDSGFASLPSFNRVFRELEGCSPSDLRAKSTSKAPIAGN